MPRAWQAADQDGALADEGRLQATCGAGGDRLPDRYCLMPRS